LIKLNANNFFTCAATNAKRFFSKSGKAVIAMILTLGLAIGGMGIHGFAHAEGENSAHISVEKARLGCVHTNRENVILQRWKSANPNINR
jgi:hypothetical protein